MTKSTASEIEQAFIGLLAEQPLGKIGVGEITDACGINRNTFYYHYKSIADLIDAVVKRFIQELLTEHPPTFNSLEDCFMAAIRLARTNKQAIFHIYNSTSRAIFERHLWKFCDFAVERYLDSLPREISPSPENRKIVSEFLRFELFGFTMDWIGHQMPDDVTERVEKFVQLFKKSRLQYR